MPRSHFRTGPLGWLSLFWLAFLVPTLLLVVGTIGYRLLGEGWTWLDALYMTVITLTTVGFGEVRELTPEGRVFTVALCLVGVFTVFYAVGEAIRVIVSGELRDRVGRQRMAQEMAALEGHQIVCGFGRTGHQVCETLSRQGIPFVVIDRDAGSLEGFDMEHGLPLAGDAGSDSVLRSAGVERARALITVLSSDPDNLFIVLSAKLLNPELRVVSRASDEAGEQKLIRAGADHVVSPHTIGGRRMAQAVLRPTVVEFLDLTTASPLSGYQLEEFAIPEGHDLASKTLAESGLHHEFGAMVMALREPDGKMLTNPHGQTRLAAGSVLVILGTRDAVAALGERFHRIN